ncbi:hypothetical protein COY32_02340 [candidate division WWE3 bacterium CG_4_10_14_0_2_um_filter_41_14]|uniref:AI-2E family transporter n=1 Tax=candidate division WWE3 bacterium CG_4_10_14_0_2_um_filter_41_14 TaxID=1975072 RepID=A0A2M7TKC0_UNCKA|nr:MAG: hypothetical protein COY32_02340 [candidate division WWE3 bacterium CG_4_10_14_0_2_um_filter_41_14]
MATITFNSRSARQFGFVIGAIFVAYWLSGLMISLFIAYILMATIMPAVHRFEKLGFPRWLAIISVFILSFTVIGLFLGVTMGPLVTEMQRFFTAVPTFVQESIAGLNIEGSVFQPYVYDAVSTVAQQLASVPLDIVKFGTTFFGGIINVIMVLIFTFYLALQNEGVHSFMVRVLPLGDKSEMPKLFESVDQRLGAWLRGQFLLMTIIGTVTYVALTIIGLPFALPLAIIAGLLEIVPIIGPIISAVPAMLVALTISPVKAVVVALLFTLIQQLEASVVVPRVMKSAVGLDPLVVLIALTVGGRMAGPVGALLSVPAVAVAMIVYDAWTLDRKTK